MRPLYKRCGLRELFDGFLARVYLRQSAGTYFHCVESLVAHVHDTSPPGDSEGMKISDTAVPTDASLPVTTMRPSSRTSPPLMRPVGVTVSPVPACANVRSRCALSATDAL